MDRRDFLGKAPLLAAAGALSAHNVAQQVGGIVRNATPSGEGAKQAGVWDGPSNPGNPPAPNMLREAAEEFLRKSPLFRRQIYEHALVDAKYAIGPQQIDPDIAVLRSLSPMAKLTFARQRYAAQQVEKALNMKPFPSNNVTDFVHQKIHDLMWDRPSIATLLG